MGSSSLAERSVHGRQGGKKQGFTQIGVSGIMKKALLDKQLRRLGWWILRQGAAHEIWTNGTEQEAVPRHREIHEYLAQKILRTARTFPGRTR